MTELETLNRKRKIMDVIIKPFGGIDEKAI
jgi:hypothetical protein